jgi:uncharacterized protein (DUF1697 family)
VRREELLRGFAALGLGSVAIYRASGNVLFRADPSRPAEALEERLARALGAILGAPPGVFVRTAEEIGGVVGRDRWGSAVGPGETAYVSFLPSPPRKVPRLPWRSRLGNVDVLAVERREVYSVGRRVGDRPGFPNGEVEKLFGLSATTRNFSTVEGVAERLGKEAPAGSS